MRNTLLLCVFWLGVLPSVAQSFPRPLPTDSSRRVNVDDGINYETRYPTCFTEFITSDLSFQGYDESQPWQGLGEATYYYRNNNPRQRCFPPSRRNTVKPLIVLDGFDPGDKRAGAEVYGKYLSYLSSTGENTFLGDTLRRLGYDVVILNFPRYETGMRGGFTYTPIPGRPPITISGLPRVRDGGADYIECNAFVPAAGHTGSGY